MKCSLRGRTPKLLLNRPVRGATPRDSDLNVCGKAGMESPDKCGRGGASVGERFVDGDSYPREACLHAYLKSSLGRVSA